MPGTYRCEYVRCGKDGCTRCPHGPYWYAYKKQGGKLHRKYLGKMDPRPPEDVEDPRDLIYHPVTATEPLAREILGVSDVACMRICAIAYESRLAYIAEQGGDGESERRLVVAAWEWLRARRDW